MSTHDIYIYISSVENDAFFLKEIVSKHLKHCLWYDRQQMLQKRIKDTD